MLVQGPLYSVAGVAGKSGGQVPPKAPPGHAGAYQMLFDASALVQLEYRKLLDRWVGKLVGAGCGVLFVVERKARPYARCLTVRFG